MECRGPGHFNQGLSNRTVEWNGMDSKERFEANCAHSQRYKKLKSLGWLDTKIYYSYNSEGFRDIDFDQRPSIIALGCSHTEGIGITQETTWPYRLEKMIGCKVWNLGVSGAALDTCFRLLNFWINNLNVVGVCCAVPEASRYEIFVNGFWTNILPAQTELYQDWISEWNKNYILYDQNAECNREKNLMAMKYICSEKKIPFYFDLLTKFGDGAFARDLMHCGTEVNNKLAIAFAKQINGDLNATN